MVTTAMAKRVPVRCCTGCGRDTAAKDGVCVECRVPEPPRPLTVDEVILDAWSSPDKPDVADEWLRSLGEYQGETPDDV